MPPPPEGGSEFYIPVYPALKRWAIIFRLAARDWFQLSSNAPRHSKVLCIGRVLEGHGFSGAAGFTPSLLRG